MRTENETNCLPFFQRPFHLEANEWWEMVMNVTPDRSSGGSKYNPMSSGVIWSRVGVAGLAQARIEAIGVNVDFKATEGREYPWRTSQSEGQLPFLLLWPL